MKVNQILFQELQKVDILLGHQQWTESEYRLIEILKASEQAYEQRLEGASAQEILFLKYDILERLCKVVICNNVAQDKIIATLDFFEKICADMMNLTVNYSLIQEVESSKFYRNIYYTVDYVRRSINYFILRINQGKSVNQFLIPQDIGAPLILFDYNLYPDAPQPSEQLLKIQGLI